MKKLFNVGIDLGTTNSVFAVYNDVYERPDILKIYGKSGITPSVIYYDKENDNYIIGEEAKDQADYYANAFSFMKIKMTDGDEETDEHNGLKMSPIDFSAKLLNHMYNGFIDHYGEDAEIKNLVVTVPAYFKDKERKCTLEAIRRSGMKATGEIRLINEPTAAALAYGDELKDAKTIVTYDLGGGTFDVTLLEIDDVDGTKIFQAKKTDGKTLGGYDFDKLIIQKLYNILKNSENADFDYKEAKLIKGSLKAEAEKIKISLSKLPKVKGTCLAFGEKKKYLIDYEITQEEFENMIETRIDETIELTKSVVKNKKIDDFVLVGGSTRIPLVEAKIKENFDNVKIVKVDPDLIVGLGAAIQAGIMDKKRDSILNEILSGGSIGISVRGDFVSYMVKDGTPIPFSTSEKFYTSGGSIAEAYIVQGKDVNLESKNNQILGKIVLDDLVVTNQSSKLDIKIDINRSGEIEVKANETAKGGATVVKLFKLGDRHEKPEFTNFKELNLFEDKRDDEIISLAEDILNEVESTEELPFSSEVKDWFADSLNDALISENISKIKAILARFIYTVKQ